VCVNTSLRQRLSDPCILLRNTELGDLASPRYTFANSLPKADATPALQDLPTHFPPHAYSDSEDSSSDDDSGDADHGSDGIAGEAYDSDEEAVQGT